MGIRVDGAQVAVNASMGADVTTRPTCIAGCVDASYQVKHVGTAGLAIGTYSIECSNSYNEQNGEGSFVPITLAIPMTNPASDDVDQLVNLAALPYSWVRLKYTRTSGTGTLNAWVTAKGWM